MLSFDLEQLTSSVNLPGKTVLCWGCEDVLSITWLGGQQCRLLLLDKEPSQVDEAEYALESRACTNYQGYHMSHAHPYTRPDDNVDVVASFKFLDRVAFPEDYIIRMIELLEPDGVLLLSFLSDRAWQQAAGGYPPEDITRSIAYPTFLRTYSLGNGPADWMSYDKFVQLFGSNLTPMWWGYSKSNDYFMVKAKPRRSK